MKLLYLITRGDEIGGAGVHVLDLAEQMQTRGHTVLLLAGGQEGELFDLARARHIPIQAVPELIHPIRPTQDLACLRQLIKIFRQEQPDLVHLHSSKAGALGRIAAWRCRIPCVFTAHGWAFTEGVSAKKRLLYLGIEYSLAFLANKIITVSEYDHKLALRYHFPKAKMQVIHNGVVNKIPDFVPRTVEQSTSRPVKLIMVARFSEPKDHITLLQALARIPTLNWSLELLGVGDKIAQAQACAAELGLQDRVHFVGNSRHVSGHLQEADIFILSSNWEGLPLSILEAMGAGLPIVASDVGGVPECVRHGHNGYLFERQNPEALSARLAELITTPATRIQLGQQARADFLDKFDIQTMVTKTEDLYQQCVTRQTA